MNTMPETPMNKQSAENSSSSSITHAKNTEFAFRRECPDLGLNRYRACRDFHERGNRCQYHYFSTGCQVGKRKDSRSSFRRGQTPTL